MKLTPIEIGGIVAASCIGLIAFLWGGEKTLANKLNVDTTTLRSVYNNPTFNTRREVYQGSDGSEGGSKRHKRGGKRKTRGRGRGKK